MPANMNKFKISIQILDSNDSPTDINISNLDVEENVEIGSLVGYITVVDEDINDSFNCFLGNNSLFIIGENLTLRTNGTIDYETKHFYELSINCSDKWNISIVKEIELSVININEIPRQISIDGKNITLSLFIKENQKTGTVIGFIYSSDPDNDEHLDVTCHTENVMCQNTLCFNTNETGSNCITEIIINSEINFDYEMHREIIFEVFVTDKENTSFSDFIKIVLLDVDEDPMDIRLNNSVENKIYLNENSVDIFVGTFSVDDVDKNENYNLQILHDSSDIFTMKINNELWLKPTANLDYETGFMNYFVIGAFKNGILALNKTYFINLIDLNEFPTSLSLSILIVPENLPQLSTIGKLSIVDIDIRNENHNFSFELLTYNTAFSISDYQLKLKENQVLNYENQSYYNLKINVIDYGIPILEKSFEISFLIQDINENPENLSLSGNEIYENSPVGSLIGIISCEDFDRNSHFTFNLNMNESNFFIENNKLFSGTIFDYEYRSSYHISITAFDNGDPKLNVSKEFEIIILNQNEMPNIIFENIQGNETTVCKFVENNQFDMAIGLFKITDVDYQDNVTCEIVTNGLPFYLQEISKSSNVTEYSLRVNESINYELKHYFPMTIKATDLKNLSKFMEIYINVENINEPPTTLSIDGSDELYINITENLQGHYLITNFITTDPDENDVIQYFIANCTNCMEKFEFTNNNSQLFLKENQYFNYEKIRNKEIKLSVKAIDSGGLSIGVNVIINILDVNDPPIITKVNFSQIPSYLVSNISIGTFDVLDEDILLSSNQITCTILQPLEWLRIEDLANDNVLTIFSTETKYINQTSVQFNIECFDNGDPKQSTLKSFHVDTMNIGNEPLNILFEWIIKSVPENRANITLGKLLFLTKFSNKSVENTSSVVFVNASEEVGIEIKKDNSFILLSSIDYETLPKFSLSFTLIDRNGNQTISSMINIMDINEAPTAIKTIESNITVYEKLRNDIYIATIYVVDQDHNQEHICQISRILINDNNIDESIQTNQSIFKMIENKLYTGIDSASGLNANFVTNVSLEVQCHDDGKPSLSINNTLFINIVDVNEGPISIKFLTDVKSIFENITVNSVLVRFQVIDEDKNDIHHCQSSNSFFRISNYVLYLAESLDYELFPKIETVLICFDKGGLNASTIWQVVVDDVDEPPRNFNISNNQWNETSDIGNLIANLTATDPEGSECHFILNECSNFKCPFTVQLNGSIILNDTLINLIDVDQIIINVTISDIFGNSQNSLLTIYIIRQTLANISINFINNFDVPEDTPIGKALFEIKIDFLSEFRTKINCELFSSGNFCVVNEYNVILNRSLDYETDQNISATVTCFQNKIRMLQKKSILINIVNVDEPLKEVIMNITESLVEGNYTNKNIGNIIIKDPEFDRKSVKCTAFNIAMDFDLDQNCLLLTTKNQCELSFQIFLSGYFNYELLLNGLNISFECTDRVSKIEKKVTIIIENANDPPTNLILNGSLTVDLDTISNGAVLGNLLVVDEDEYQSHNIIIEYPGNKYFYIGDDNKLIVQNFEFAWAGSVNCTFDVSDNGLPQINKAFNLTFTFIKSTGEISLSNRFINITNKANTIIGKISFSKINSNLIGYQLSNIPNDAFSIINNELWLIKDAYQLPFTNITIRIRVIDSFSYVSISEGNIRLEIKGTSICHSNSSNCHKNATCISKNNSDEFQCFCNDGYEGNGTYCEEINECVINPCMGNSSFCINMINDFQCQCEHNRSGKTCEIIPITICSITDCFHGICGENKTCTCMSGWSGPNCNESIDDCIGNPCNNHGICEDKLNGFVCNCFENFTGILCEFDQNSCIDCNKNSEICIQLKNNETYCLSYLKMLYINFNMNDSLLNKFTNYQMDFYKFLLEISEFENYTIYFHINKLNSINYYQMNFTGIDNDENIISIDESRDIIKQHCNNENRQSSQGIICSGLFPVDSKTRKMASSLRILVIEYWIIILILWLFN